VLLERYCDLLSLGLTATGGFYAIPSDAFRFFGVCFFCFLFASFFA